ncbi:MAG: 16S rRNA (cytosine(1402)-N(4))-methyltransferase RsmH [Bacillota bacterium]
MVELHLPVMEKEVLHYLICNTGGVYVDATVGDGGHAEAILKNINTEGHLIGIDWDEDALQRAETRLNKYRNQLTLVQADYSKLQAVLSGAGFSQVDGILIDLGASTLQLMDADRGFSFHHTGNLDMRMDRRRSLTAKEIVNHYSADQLAEIFFRFGEERFSRRIAARIVREREKINSINSSSELAEIVKAAVPARFRRHGGHPARRVFQALRLVVNQELENITAVLPQAVESLAAKGRLSVIAYHSLEDRLVKRFFREKSGHCSCPPNMPCVCRSKAELRVLTGKAVKPTEKEVESNPRARSARLRAAEKI